MRDTKSQKFAGYLTYQLFISDSFRALKPSARDILILVFFEIDIKPLKKKARKYTPVITNRNNIKLPYADITKSLGYHHKTVWEAFKDFFAKGFLEVVTHGGGGKGDCNIYKISEQWRTWKYGQTINKIRKNGKIGWQKVKK